MNVFKFLAWCIAIPLLLHPLGWIVLILNAIWRILDDEG